MLKHIASVPVPEGVPAPMIPSQAELEQWYVLAGFSLAWHDTYLARSTRSNDRNLASANLLRNLIPKLPSVFPSTQAQANAFGPGIYLLGGAGQNAASEIGSRDEKEGMQMDLKDGEVWGLIASFGLQAPPDEQTALVSSLREKVCFAERKAQGSKQILTAPFVINLDFTHRALSQKGLGLGSSRRIALEKCQLVLEWIGECGRTGTSILPQLIWLRFR